MNHPRRETNVTGDVGISRHELQEIIRHELGSAAAAELMGSGIIIDAGGTNNPLQVFNTVPVSIVIKRLEESKQVNVQSIIYRLRLKLGLDDQSGGVSATAAAAPPSAAAASAAGMSATAAAAPPSAAAASAAVADDEDYLGNIDDDGNASASASAACAATDAAQSASTAYSTDVDTCNTSGASASSGSSSFGNKRKRNNTGFVSGTHQQHDAEVLNASRFTINY